MVNPVEAAHYSQMYDGLMHIWGHVMCISRALLSLCFMARDGISQPFKLHTASLKQSSYSAFFHPGNMFHEQSLKFSFTCTTNSPERRTVVALNMTVACLTFVGK